MTSLDLVLRRLHTQKSDALRDMFEAHLRTTLLQGRSEETALQLLERTGDGYSEGIINAAWTGFQWGGDHVRSQVDKAMQHLDGRRGGRRLGDSPVDPARPNAEVVAASYRPTQQNEAVDWSLPLFDSDGFEHRLVDLGGIQVVTKISFAYAVWDRKTLQMRDNPGPGELTIGNTPMPEVVRERRRKEGAAILGQLHAQAALQVDAEPDEDRGQAPRG